MATTLNIQNVDTVPYRTDCFASYSPIKKHYIRNHNVSYYNTSTYETQSLYHKGYEKKIPDVQGQLGQTTKTFDIGHNPYATNPSNPIVCDKLLLFGSCRDETSPTNLYLCSDTLYNTLKFDVPMLLINNLADNSNQSKIWYSVPSQNRYCIEIDELYPVMSGNNMLICCNGRYYQGNSTTYTTLTNQAIGQFSSAGTITGDYSARAGQADISINFYDYAQERTPVSSWLAKAGMKGIVCTASELRSRFTYFSPKPQSIETIKSYTYGALMIPVRQSAIYARYYTANQCKYAWLTSVRKPDNWYNEWNDLFQLLIIPFRSQAEYEAAKASIYTWPDYTVTTLNNNSIE